MNKSKHIVILSYLFPPHSNVGGRRQYFFAKYLTELGYKVTVITADLPLKENWIWETDLGFANIIKIKPIDHPKGYTSVQSIFNFLYHKLNNRKQGFFKRIAWKIGEFFLPINFNIRLNFDANKLIEDLDKVDYIIATGGPWLMLEYGVQLKAASQAKLVLDYRDPWNAVMKDVYLDSLNNKGALSFILDKKYRKIEAKLIKSADLVISVSDPISKNCNQLLQANQTKTIYNGFDASENNKTPTKQNNFFNITFSGQLRAEQDLSIFIKGLTLALKQMPELSSLLKVNFIGTQLSPKEVLSPLTNSGLEAILNITPFLPKKEAMSYLKTAQLLLQISFKTKKGIVSSKLIQYLGIHKPIALISNNDDIMERIITETNAGYIFKSSEEFSDFIIKSVVLWKKNQHIPFSPVEENVQFYSFKSQVSIFEKMLKTL
ncbi:MAG: hypothetical protein N4A35_09840 [Flavobacteriales bacterium]|jgi:hypothetical protein|nr:hypothetical protein [Flavobacteriales bacterium]